MRHWCPLCRGTSGNGEGGWPLTRRTLTRARRRRQAVFIAARALDTPATSHRCTLSTSEGAVDRWQQDPGPHPASSQSIVMT